MLTYPIASAKSKSNDFAADVRAGLEMRGQKELPSKYLYDDVGSALFEVISVLPEYGLTRADERLLRRHADDIVRRVPKPVVVAELAVEAARRRAGCWRHCRGGSVCPIARSKFLRQRWRCASGNWETSIRSASWGLSASIWMDYSRWRPDGSLESRYSCFSSEARLEILIVRQELRS